MKNEMITCLHEQLVKVGLKQAEIGACIRDLRQTERELESDRDALSKIAPETVARVQEELMAAKLREANLNREFAEVKGELKRIKADLELHINVNYLLLVHDYFK